MINYGNDTDINEYKVTEMFPAIYAKEYIDRMFADAGYTYTSTFFNASLFKHLIIPFNGKDFKPTQLALSPRRVKADTPLIVSSGINNYTLDSSIHPFLDWQTNVIRLTNETLDANNQYNTTTGELTVAASGRYRVSFDVTLQAEVTPKAGGAAAGDILANGKMVFANHFYVVVSGLDANGISSRIYTTNLTPAVTYQTANPTNYPDANFVTSTDLSSRNSNPPNKYQVNAEMHIPPGSIVTIEMRSTWAYNSSTSGAIPPYLFSHPFYDAVSLNGYHADFKVIMSDANLSLNLVDSPYVEGDQLDMFNAIPEKIKQRDFLTSIIKMFNLYMIPDTNNPKNMIIETREDFYTTDIVDWSSKLDYSQPMNLTPTSVTNKQKYTFTYKKDADYYNKKYEASWLDLYGTRTIYLENDFNKSEHKTELIFSPTPMVGQLTNDRVVSTIVDVDATLQQKTVKSNIRILYYSGLKHSNSNWIHSSYGIGIWRAAYPYAGHFNDPYTPTIDLNFGLPKEIYWDNTYGSITVTDANLYKVYHQKELEQLTDKDSKIFKGSFLLNPVDIANLSFRSSYWFENEYWTLHKVMYGSSVYQPSKCEFLKLKQVTTPSTFTEELIGGLATIGDESTPIMEEHELTDGNVLSTKANSVKGKNNFIDKSAMFVDIVGDNNKVFTASKNISISGDNNVIESNLENITLVNTSDKTVTESNVTYVKGQKTGGSGIVLLNTIGTYTQDLEMKGYEIDTTSGVITIELTPGLYEGYEQTFKKIAGEPNFNLVNTVLGGLIEGATSLPIRTVNEAVTLYWNGTDYMIKGLYN
jgi:hypothetical protein